MSVNLRNGEIFEGIKLAYFPNRTTRFDLSFEGVVVPVEARMGDTPALTMLSPPRDGLLTVVHEAAPARVIYTEWEKFVGFTEHKDFAQVSEEHAAAGLDQDRVVESYTRHSKALIAVGGGNGSDAPMGLETELVALTNPYTLGPAEEMAVALTYEGAPRVDVQVEVYERDAGDAVTVTKLRTDAEGIVRFPVTPGLTYLVDSVVIRDAPDTGGDPDAPLYETLWASLTFAVPAE